MLFIALVECGVYWAFFDMTRFPAGEYFTEETSPDGKYTVKAYSMEMLQIQQFSQRAETHLVQVLQ